MVGDGSSDAATGLLAAFRPGSRLAGYLLEEQLGAGGMAVVFRAVDERLGRPVALKILAPGLASDRAFQQRFMHESRTAAAVDDPHIIPVYEAGEAQGVLFIAMRLVPGKDVRTLLHEQGPLPPAQAAAIIAQVASALDAAHAAGLVHRDVKPANMLIDIRAGRADHVYLTDFGISKQQTSSIGLTGTGQFLGTPDYIAPEQIQGGRVDGRTDQYSLACAAFELLTGQPPFQRDQGMAIIWAQLHDQPPPIGSLRPGLPATLDAVFGRALAKAPQHRFATCQEFADTLQAALSVAPGPPGPRSFAAGGTSLQARDPTVRGTHHSTGGQTTRTLGPGPVTGQTVSGMGRGSAPPGQPAPRPAANAPGRPEHRRGKSRRTIGLAVVAVIAAIILVVAVSQLLSGPAGPNHNHSGGSTGSTSASGPVVQWRGQITLSSDGIDLDSAPPVVNTSTTTLSLSGGTLEATSPATFAAWNRSSTPSYRQCHLWAQTNGTTQLQLHDGMDLCVNTGNRQTAFLKNVSVSSDGSSATTIATIWGTGTHRAGLSGRPNQAPEWQGHQITINSTGTDLDSIPPANNTGSTTLSLSGATLEANSPATVAAWAGSRTPSYGQCHIWAETNGVTQLQLANGMNLCVVTGAGHTVYLKNITLSSDNSSATAIATIWRG
jgi:serine/threonine-protein kinase